MQPVRRYVEHRYRSVGSTSRTAIDFPIAKGPDRIKAQRGALEHPQCVAKSSSKLNFWLLELVPYIVKIVPKLGKVGTRARACSDAKFPLPNKILFPS
jgi:hypothetical protein